MPKKGGCLKTKRNLQVYLGEAGGAGKGVFAAKAIAEGELVLEFGGDVLAHDEVEDFARCLELPSGVFLGPSGEVDDFVNHSCEPNCYVVFDGEHAELRALAPIVEDEQITFDYSLTMWTDETRFPCSCGAKRCRGYVSTFHKLPEEVKDYYRSRGLVCEDVTQPG